MFFYLTSRIDPPTPFAENFGDKNCYLMIIGLLSVGFLFANFIELMVIYYL